MKPYALLGVVTGLALLVGAILLSGFYIIGEHEASIVVEYEAWELVGGRPEDLIKNLIRILGGLHEGGSTHIVKRDDPSLLALPLGNLHWHRPWPLGRHHLVSLKPRDYELKVPFMFSVDPQYYLVLTEGGFEFLSQYDLYLPEKSVAVLFVNVKFEISELENWAKMDKYGYGDDLIRLTLIRDLEQRIFRRINEIYTEKREKHPDLDEETLLKLIADYIRGSPEEVVSGFQEYLSGLRGRVGLTFLEYRVVDLRAEPISDFL
ncbi:MAG: hypothetical protein ACE5GD_03400 [Candidatus Geothermarchaeales archaeon]